MFRIITDVVWDLQTGQIGIKTKKETCVLKVAAEGGDYQLQKNPLEFFSLPIPAWALRAPLTTLTTGDVVVLEDDQLAFFISATDNSSQIKVLKPEVGEVSTVDVGTNILLGQNDSILCVKNIVSTTGGDGGVANQLPLMLLFMNDREESSDDLGKVLALSMMMGNQGGANNMLLPLMMMGKGGMNMKTMLMLSMMQGGGTAAADGTGMNNMLLPLMLMGGKGDMDSKMLMFMMMSQQQGAGGDANANGMNMLLPLMMMGDGEMDTNTLMMMMLMQNGGSGIQNIAPLFMMREMFDKGVEDATYDDDTGHWIDDAGKHYDPDGNEIEATDERAWNEDGEEDV